MPVEQVKSLFLGVIFDGSHAEEGVLTAVNRRGRSVRLRVTATPLVSDGDDPSGALLLTEPSDPPTRTPPP